MKTIYDNWKIDLNDEYNKPYNELEPGQVLHYLAIRRRKPQSEEEEQWLESIKKTEAAGYGIEIPGD